MLPFFSYLHLLHYKSPTAFVDMHKLTCGIISLLHSVSLFLSTISSLSSWFTSSCTYQFITAPVFILTIWHWHSLRLSHQTYLSIPQILSSIAYYFWFHLDCLHGCIARIARTRISGHWRLFILVSCTIQQQSFHLSRLWNFDFR